MISGTYESKYKGKNAKVEEELKVKDQSKRFRLIESEEKTDKRERR